MIDTTLVSYEDIALEYYNPVRHPTCANFREASALILRKWLQAFPHGRGLFCEVGAGKSLLAELLAAQGLGVTRLIITDSSPSMLSYSRQWADKRTHLIIADSAMLPIASGSLDLLVSSLGDPYNELRFWGEAYRTLRSGGVVFFTTPSYDWATAFRAEGDRNEVEHAEFELSSGERVYVASKIYPSNEQIELIGKAGLVIKEYAQIALSEITVSPLSPKLLMDRGPDASVLEGYIAVKPQIS
jgi:SAM-dependent methyltransferase